MVRAAIILLLLACNVRAEWYTATMPDGRTITVPVRTDPSLDAAVSGVTTSAVMPEVQAQDPDPMQSPPLELPYIVLQDQDETNKWYGVYVASGEIIGGVLDHASPRDHNAIKARLQAERQARRDIRQDTRTVKANMVALSTTTNTAAAQAKQIDELRKAVRDLSSIVLKLTKDQSP